MKKHNRFYKDPKEAGEEEVKEEAAPEAGTAEAEATAEQQ